MQNHSRLIKAGKGQTMISINYCKKSLLIWALEIMILRSFEVTQTWLPQGWPQRWPLKTLLPLIIINGIKKIKLRDTPSVALSNNRDFSSCWSTKIYSISSPHLKGSPYLDLYFWNKLINCMVAWCFTYSACSSKWWFF